MWMPRRREMTEITGMLFAISLSLSAVVVLLSFIVLNLARIARALEASNKKQ